jgi:proteic killer suppression protein
MISECRQATGSKRSKADRAGQYSIRINDQWRICFAWDEEGPRNVEIVDYHS